MNKLNLIEVKTKELNCGWCAAGFVGGAAVSIGIGVGIAALT